MIKKKVTNHVFISSDGREWQSEEYCNFHEKKLKISKTSYIREDAISKIKHHKLDGDYDLLLYRDKNIPDDDVIFFFLAYHVDLSEAIRFSKLYEDKWCLVKLHDSDGYSDLQIREADDVLQQYIEIMDLMKGE